MKNHFKQNDTISQHIQHEKKYNGYSLANIHELIYDENKFISTILMALGQAIQLMKKGQFLEALTDLADAQKVLEYGANCGKIIDRRLIITILHNQACCYQRVGDKIKALKYIEAINYNLRAHIKSMQSTPVQTGVFDQNLIKTLRSLSSPEILVSRKLELAKYQLRYCSLTSQIGHRKQALSSAKIALRLFKQFFSDLITRNKIQKPLKDDSSETQSSIIYNAIQNCKGLKQETDCDKIQQYLHLCKYSIKKWQEDIKKYSHLPVSKNFDSYSIGKLVDLKQIQYLKKTSESSSPEQFLPVELCRQICNMSMAHFQIGTEYRMKCDEQYKSEVMIKQQSQQYKMGMLYHLLSIMIIGLNFPFEALFMRQVMNSFEHHYRIKLQDKLQKCSEKQINLKLIYQSYVNKKSKDSSNNSINPKKYKNTSKPNQQIKTKNTHSKSKKKSDHKSLKVSKNLSIKKKKYQNSQSSKKLAQDQYLINDRQNNVVRQKRRISGTSNSNRKTEKSHDSQKNYYFIAKQDKIKQSKRSIRTFSNSASSFNTHKIDKEEITSKYGLPSSFYSNIKANNNNYRSSRGNSLTKPPLLSIELTKQDTIADKNDNHSKNKRIINSQSAYDLRTIKSSKKIDTKSHIKKTKQKQQQKNPKNKNDNSKNKQYIKSKTKLIAINNYYM